MYLFPPYAYLLAEPDLLGIALRHGLVLAGDRVESAVPAAFLRKLSQLLVQ